MMDGSGYNTWEKYERRGEADGEEGQDGASEVLYQHVCIGIHTHTHTQPHTPTLQTYPVITLSSPRGGGCAEGQAEDGDSVWMLCDAILDRVEQSHAAQGKEQ
jgi:hypothetical protein